MSSAMLMDRRVCKIDFRIGNWEHSLIVLMRCIHLQSQNKAAGIIELRGMSWATKDKPTADADVSAWRYHWPDDIEVLQGPRGFICAVNGAIVGQQRFGVK